MTNKEYHLMCAEMHKALSEGKTIQVKEGDGWECKISGVGGVYRFFRNKEYRVNPEPKKVYFALLKSVDGDFYTSSAYESQVMLVKGEESSLYKIVKIYEEEIENA